MRVALFHIPKTGGTSLHDFLSTHFPAPDICPERFRSFGRFSPEQLAAYRYFSAHMDFATLQSLPGPLYTITIMREPKARIISLYYFWRSHSDETIEKLNLAGPRLAKQLGLLEFLKTQAHGIPGSINNTYVRTLLGHSWSGQRGQLLLNDGEALRVAMRNLLTIDTVGFVEDMPGLFTEVCQRLSVPLPDPLPWARSSKEFGLTEGSERVEPEEITPEIDARLDHLTRLDRILYENARRMFLR
ncbi:sulfotransferase family 2 domain-containing protein [Salipiger abyssi]|uniref:sulfotransferase family 2 domain-containing protein n=1 Tax=Salipiger abyssi TaxID=1250539 RepID=UPI001A90796B|nr:sulfotransferase family 2 domain-containing protein [Salipiger abyssi]MBN9889851.1 sulfotransferase family 2 domain-containing protein [Salipiger abyssi]